LRQSAFFLFFDNQLIALFCNLAESCQHAAAGMTKFKIMDYRFNELVKKDFNCVECAKYIKGLLDEKGIPNQKIELKNKSLFGRTAKAK
jgi:hypothetical protein